MTQAKMIVMGDSISVQYGPFLEQYLAGKIQYTRLKGQQEALQNLDIPRGANCGDSSAVLVKLKALGEAGALDADLLVLNCGLHDIKTDPATGVRQVSLEQYRQNLRDIVSVVGSFGLALVWVRTTPCDEAIHNSRVSDFHRFADDVIRYNAAADEVMAESGTPSIDLFGFTANLGCDLYCDHVHFNENVRREQAAFIAGWVQGWMSARGSAQGRMKTTGSL